MSELEEGTLLASIDPATKTPLERLKDEHTTEFTDLVEVVYGDNMLSQGGSECANV
jgi:hypothetical protein